MKNASCAGPSIWIFGLGLLMGVAGIAHAAGGVSYASSADQDQWRYSATLYAFLPSVHGTSTFPNGASGPTFKLDAHSIISNLNFAFMGRFRAERGPWSVAADWIHSDIGDSVNGTRRFTVPRYPGVDVTADFKLRSKSNLLTLAGGYRLVSEPRRELHLIFGARMLDMSQRLDWKLSGAIANSLVIAGMTRAGMTHWDAIVGAWGREWFGRDLRWFIPYYMDAGTGDSRFHRTSRGRNRLCV